MIETDMAMLIIGVSFLALSFAINIITRGK